MNFSIKYITPTEFKTLSFNKTAKEVCPFPHYWFSDKVTTCGDKFTREIDTCTAIVLNDTMLHLAPELNEVGLSSKMKNFLLELKDKVSNIQGFIIGARARNNGHESFRLFENMMNIFEQENIDYSALGGKSLENMYDNLFTSNDIVMFTQDGNIGLEEFMQNKNLSREEVIDLLKYYYSTVKISDNHNIIL